MKIVRSFSIFFGIGYTVFFFHLGFSEETLSIAIRLSARISFFIFMMTFIASPIHHFFKSALSKSLLKNRSQLGISFAISHLIHLGFLISFGILNLADLKEGLNAFALIFGGLTYIFIIAMLFTSFPRWRKRLSASSWKHLHTAGSWLIFIVFTNSYFGRALGGLTEYMPYAVVLVLAFVIRVSYLIKNKLLH